MDKLVLDCTGGARKDSLVDAMLARLDASEREAFVEAFGAIGLDGVTAALEGDADAPHLRIECDGFSEGHSHHSGHGHRTYAEVVGIVGGLDIPDAAKADASGIYAILAEAEAKAHGVPIEQTHFHEVGNNFAIGYIVAFAMLMDKLAPSSVEATPITTGFGFVDCAHGRLPIPAPATANILEGMDVCAGDVEGELTTPTGAAMVKYYLQRPLP